MAQNEQDIPLNKRLVVSGWGAITGLGNNVETTWQNALAGNHGFSLVEMEENGQKIKIPGATITNFDNQKMLAPKITRHVPEYAQYASMASLQAGIDAGVLEKYTYQKDKVAYERCRLIGLNPNRVGIEIATAVGGATYAGEIMRSIINGERVHPLSLDMIDANRAHNIFALYSGITGPGATVVVACSSGQSAFETAALRMIAGQEGRLFPPVDAMFVTGTDRLLNGPVAPRAYQAMGLYGKEDENGGLDNTCRPFDQEYGGVLIGDGAISAFMEPLDQALRRKKTNNNLKIYAELVGIGDRTEANPESKGQTNQAAIEATINQALTTAHIESAQVGLVVAHGPATLADIHEANAIYTIFGSDAAVTAPKSFVGHMQGGAGSMNAFIANKAIETGQIPAIVGLSNPIHPDVDFVMGEARTRKIDYAVSLALGLGGKNVALVWKRIPQSELARLALTV